MTTRRILKEFRLTEISAVDAPAVEHARVTLMKRHDPDEENTEMHRDEPLAFDTLEQAMAHLQTLGMSKSAAMSEAARRHPNLRKRYIEEGAEMIAKAAAARRSGPSDAVRKFTNDFNATVDAIMVRDGVPRSVAMSRARAENPVAYLNYQAAG